MSMPGRKYVLKSFILFLKLISATLEDIVVLLLTYDHWCFSLVRGLVTVGDL